MANETMRLRPVAPVVLLAATRDVVIDDVAVPRGTWVALLTRPPAVDARHFGDPTAFRPERWLGTVPNGVVPNDAVPNDIVPDGRVPDGAPLAHDPSVFLPFGSGPRICPGRSLALLEMRLVLATLYSAFDVERAAGADDVREAFAFTMHPVGLRVRLRRRAGLTAPGLPLRDARPEPAPTSPGRAP